MRIRVEYVRVKSLKLSENIIHFNSNDSEFAYYFSFVWIIYNFMFFPFSVFAYAFCSISIYFFWALLLLFLFLFIFFSRSIDLLGKKCFRYCRTLLYRFLFLHLLWRLVLMVLLLTCQLLFKKKTNWKI